MIKIYLRSYFTGLAILFFALQFIIYYQSIGKVLKKSIKIYGFISSEKINLFKDSNFITILNNTYGIDTEYFQFFLRGIDYSDINKIDYIFASNKIFLDLYMHNDSIKYNKIEDIFYSPLVVYTRKFIIDAFVKQGFIYNYNNVNYINMEKLFEAILNDVKWADIGINELYGNIAIKFPDPRETDLGYLFAGLVANILNNGQVPDSNFIYKASPKIKKIFNQSGFLEKTPEVLFNNLIKTDFGLNPLMIGYENQILEFSVINHLDWKKIKDDIVILYPVPTLIGAHSFIALTKNGENMLNALRSQDLQLLSWRHHGFRPVGLSGLGQLNDFDVRGLPVDIKNVITLPATKTMHTIIEITGH
ncbi:MAG: hypothetical protein LBV23_11690 [Deltaproteobacteria bacterium]|jgi:hypothetical protein|nr:hypothetical protein [Deltaproteobacteria bacterium]